MQPHFEAVVPARVEFDDGRPVAPDFGDGYFGRADGAAESTAVFLEGNRLPARFGALAPGEVFTIGETGFGTGLNMLLAARLFAAEAPRGARLSLISAEKHPLARPDLARALADRPALAPWSDRLQAQYPAPAPGFHRIELDEYIDLILMLGDADAMWRRQPAPVDAWFLDGFAPPRNPAMWSPALFQTIARSSRPGATLATFSAAGRVRRGLVGAGFEVRRQPGFGGKRHRLEATRPGQWVAAHARTGFARIAGAGLAGATTARALAERGWRVEVADPGGVAAGASGNLAGIVYTTPSGITTPQNRFYQASYMAALRWLHARDAERLGLARLNGVVQHVTGSRQLRKLRSASDSGVWPAELLEWLDDARVLMPGGGVVRPAAWCRHLLDHGRITLTDTHAGPDAGGDADVTIACTGANEPRFEGLPALPLRRIRGQVTECAATPESRGWAQAQCHEGYVTPAVDGIHCVGATFDLRDRCADARDDDDRRNLQGLRARLPDYWRALGGPGIRITGRRVGFRCQTPDFLPVVGAVEIGDPATAIRLNLAHGSRGLAGTVLAAEALADELSGLAPAVDSNVLAALAPTRFTGRAR